MAASLTHPAPPRGTLAPPPPLENGLRLSAAEFLRRYDAMPETKKAELIGGVVYMGSPVRYDQHGQPDHLLQGWLFTYQVATPGVRAGSNATLRLGPAHILQPDAVLMRTPECGGRTRLDEKGYLVGPPDLVIEIAASSAAIDFHEKREIYRAAGVSEFLLWRTEDEEIDWWSLQEGIYRELPGDELGVIRSRIFPGLWLDTRAALARDPGALVRTLHAGLAAPEHAAFLATLRLA